MVLLTSIITKVLEYKAGLNRRNKFVCVTVFLSDESCSCDLLVTSLSTITIQLNSSRLTVVLHTVPGF